MQLSSNGLSLLKELEGFSSTPYLDSAGVPTIGYGSTYYTDRRKVKMSDRSISEHEGESLLSSTILLYEQAVNELVKSAINQSQFDALVLFVYNVGKSNFGSSTLLRKVNTDPNDKSIGQEFMRWVKAGGKTLTGLVNRRKREANLYFNEATT